MSSTKLVPLDNYSLMTLNILLTNRIYDLEQTIADKNYEALGDKGEATLQSDKQYLLDLRSIQKNLEQHYGR